MYNYEYLARLQAQSAITNQEISEQTGVPCYVAEDPVSCVAIGAGKVLEDMRLYEDVVYDYRRGD